MSNLKDRRDKVHPLASADPDPRRYGWKMAKVRQNQAETSVTVESLQGKLRFSYLLNGALGVLVIILAVVLISRSPGAATVRAEEQFDGESTTVEEASPTPEGSIKDEEAAAAGHVRGIADDPLAIGSMDAPVVISEWTDYRCPYCALFATETLPILLADYVESGQVRIEFNDVYFFGDESFDAAVAARAAGNQGHYLEFIEALYSAAPANGGHPDMPRETLIGFAQEAGVPDIAQFEADLDSPDLMQQVEASHEQAVGWGISSVPFFVVGDQAVAGAQPLEVFTELITEAQN